MALTDETRERMLDAGGETLADQVDQVSLHSSDPGTDGSNELSGGSYSRQTVTWGTAASGAISVSGDESFPVPAGTVSHFGMWDSGESRFAGGGTLSATENFATAGTYTLTDATVSTT